MTQPRISVVAMVGRFAIGRLYIFREEALTLWRAFWHPETPLPIKAATLFVALYLVSPLDLLRDAMPFTGLLDDLVLVPLMVSLIVRFLPPHIVAKPVRATARRR